PPRAVAGSIIVPAAGLKIVPARRRAVVPAPRPSRAYRRTFGVLLDQPEFIDRYDGLILRHAARWRLDPRLVKAIIAAESEFSTAARSPRGARGLMQIMPATAEELGVPGDSLHEPDANIRAGTAYLAVLYRAAWKEYRLKGVPYRKAPNWVVQRIIAAYNAGPRALRKDVWRAETRSYVRKVLLFYRSDVPRFRSRQTGSISKALALPAGPHASCH
ncbi:MAG: lytic transglycosylase domain-containing protein, partial [Elusimicrobia bacterium]|nr:lytic transglycosylase domain-containing protein [Elusimicrobiota bacterium]